MRSDFKTLCVVPARSGSKSIPLKNLRTLRGKKLVEWPIVAALECDFISKVVCSSDSEEILEVARISGAQTRRRPSGLATDEAASPPVVLDVIKELESRGENFDFVFMLEPTSPLTDSKDLRRAMDLLIENFAEFDSLVSVCQSISGHPDFTFSLDKKNGLKSINQQKWAVKRRQEISPLYFIEGSLYLSKVESFKETIAFVQDRTFGMKMPRENSFEIDDELDFCILDAIMGYKQFEKKKR